MILKGRVLLVMGILLATLTCHRIYAQDDAEFRMEIGGGLGTSSYLGDVNSSLFKNQKVAATALWRYLFDHHNVLKLQANYAGVKGSGKVNDDFIPQDVNSGTVSTSPYIYNFSGSLIDLNCMYELNFWPYGYYGGYMGYKRLTPFLQFGIGGTYATASKKLTANIPVGFGVKYRLGKRVNLAFDWAMHFSLSDKLDNLPDPQGITSEAFKNKDNYCTTMITLTYSFAPICPTCNKAD